MTCQPRTKSLGIFFFPMLVLVILVGCDFHVIAPWERGGIRSQPRVVQPPNEKAVSPNQKVESSSPVKTPPPPQRTMPIRFPPDHDGCPAPKEPWTKILLNKKKWESGMTVFFDEPTKTSDGRPVTGLRSVSIHYHILQQGAPGSLMLATTIKAKSKEGGKKNSGLISFSKLKTLQRFLRARQDVFTVFCSRSIAVGGPGKMSPSIAIQFGRDNNWIPPLPKSPS